MTTLQIPTQTKYQKTYVNTITQNQEKVIIAALQVAKEKGLDEFITPSEVGKYLKFPSNSVSSRCTLGLRKAVNIGVLYQKERGRYFATGIPYEPQFEQTEGIKYSEEELQDILKQVR